MTRHILDDLRELHTVKEELRGLKKREKKLAGRIREHITANGDTEGELHDGELGILAELKAPGSVQWDVRPLSDAVVCWARDEGLLTVVTNLYDAMSRQLGSGSIELVKMRTARHEGAGMPKLTVTST